MNYFIKKASQLITVLIVASFFTFAMSYFAPGDPAEMKLKAHDIIPTEARLNELRSEMGLDDSFFVQYTRWISGVLKGDLGESYISGEPVIVKVIPRLNLTLKLAIFSFALLLTFSFSLGILSAIYKGSFVDYFIRFISFAAISMPSFWLGMLLIYYFSVKLQIFKITAEPSLSNMLLPALTLSIPLMGRYIRVIRTAILEEYSQNYVIGEKSRGGGKWSVLFKNILPNAIVSIITLLGLSAALLLGGTVIVESIFSWQGLGSMALEAITYRDYPVLQSYVLFMSVIYVLVNFTVDIVSQAVDPRLREVMR